MLKSKVALGVAVVALLSIVTAGPMAAQEAVTLLVWDQHGDAAATAVETIYNGFMEKYPHITIERELVPLEQLRATARTALASGTGPDVMYHDVTPGRELFRAGLLLPLDEYAEQYGWRDRFFPAGLQWTLVDDQISGLGLEYEFVGVFVNKTIFEEEGWEVPQTLDQLLAYCQDAKEKGYVPVAHGQNPGWQNYFSFTMPVHNVVGVEAMRQLLFEGEGRWDTPEMVRAVEVFDRDMRDAGCFVEDVNGLDWQGQQDLFFAGEAPLFPTGTWVVGEILNNMPDYEVEMMPFPAIEEGGNRVYTAGMGSAYFISASTEHPDEAALFLDYIFSEEAVKIWIEDAGFIPPVQADTSGLDVPPLLQFVLETLQAAGKGEGDVQLGWNVDLLVPEEFDTMMRDGFQAVMADLKTPEEQLADLQAIWEAREQ